MGRFGTFPRRFDLQFSSISKAMEAIALCGISVLRLDLKIAHLSPQSTLTHQKHTMVSIIEYAMDKSGVLPDPHPPDPSSMVVGHRISLGEIRCA
jgi:hypothetical protein